jgi:hypothetical protein
MFEHIQEESELHAKFGQKEFPELWKISAETELGKLLTGRF